MNDVVFLSNSLSATIFSLITAVLLFTLFAVAGGILVRKAGWKILPAITAFLIIAVIRGLLPLEFTKAKIIHYPENVGKAFRSLNESRISSLSVLSVVGLVWLAGAIVSFAIFLWKMIAQHKSIKRISENASNEVKDVFFRIINDAKISGKGTLFVSEFVSSPMMVGFFRPIILLPKQCENLPEEELTLIMRHELAHFRYHDLWKKLVLCLLCCVFWWNPAAYYLRRAATQTQELRADAFACSGADDVTRLNYATAMIDTLKSRKAQEKLIAAGYFNRSSDRYLKQRFKEILQFPQEKRKTALVWAAVVLALGICASSYMVNFQPYYSPNSTGEYWTEADSDAFILKVDDGVYQLYSGDQWVATLSEDDISSGIYDTFPIIDASINNEEGDMK